MKTLEQKILLYIKLLWTFIALSVKYICILFIVSLDLNFCILIFLLSLEISL